MSIVQPVINQREAATPATLITVFVSVVLLLIFMVTRMHRLLALPIFYDEAGHITWAQQVFHGQPLVPLEGAKALMPYSLSLFDPSINGPFIARLLVALFGLVGIASAIGLGRILHSKRASYIAGILWLLCPYLFFFERLAVVDATLAAMVTFASWTLIRLSKKQTIGAAILAGVVLGLCPLAKFTGLVFAPLPLLILFLNNGSGNDTGHISTAGHGRRLRLLIIVYTVFCLILAIPALIVFAKHSETVAINVDPVSSNLLINVNLLLNSALTIDAFFSYFSVPFLILILSVILFGLRTNWRQCLIPLWILVVPLLVLIFTSGDLHQRYLVISVPGVVLLSAIGLANLVQPVATKYQKWIPWRATFFLFAVFGIWFAAFVAPFMTTAFSDPSVLALPWSDKNEYVTIWASGYAVREAATYLLQKATVSGQPVTSVGMVGNCRAIPMSLPVNSRVTVLCPTMNSSISDAIAEEHNFMRQQIAQNGSALVLVEINGLYSIYPLPISSQLLAIFPRPGGTAPVELFRVSTLWPTF